MEGLVNKNLVIRQLSPRESLIKAFALWEKAKGDYERTGKGTPPLSTEQFSEFIEMNYQITYKI